RGGPEGLGHGWAGAAAEEAAHRALDTVEAVAVGAVREEAEAQHSPGAVDAVNGDGADRIVDHHRPLDEDGGPTDEHSGHSTDHEGPEARHEAAGPRARGEAREHP